jgi:hypothetical protein
MKICGSNVSGGDRTEAGRLCGAIEPACSSLDSRCNRNYSLSHPLVGKDVRQFLQHAAAQRPLRQPRLYRRGAIFETRTLVQSSTVQRPIERKCANERGRSFSRQQREADYGRAAPARRASDPLRQHALARRPSRSRRSIAWNSAQNSARLRSASDPRSPRTNAATSRWKARSRQGETTRAPRGVRPAPGYIPEPEDGCCPAGVDHVRTSSATPRRTGSFV